jgi:hypothetical protein
MGLFISKYCFFQPYRFKCVLQYSENKLNSLVNDLIFLSAGGPGSYPRAMAGAGSQDNSCIQPDRCR